MAPCEPVRPADEGRLTRIATLLDEGALQVTVGAVLGLADARASHEMLEGTRAHPRGKIVLRIGG